MNLYLVTQSINSDYDTYDAMIVCAATEEEARIINPGGYNEWGEDSWYFIKSDGECEKNEDRTWCLPSQVIIICIGKASENIKPGVILSSFNAG